MANACKLGPGCSAIPPSLARLAATACPASHLAGCLSGSMLVVSGRARSPSRSPHPAATVPRPSGNSTRKPEPSAFGRRPAAAALGPGPDGLGPWLWLAELGREDGYDAALDAAESRLDAIEGVRGRQ